MAWGLVALALPSVVGLLRVSVVVRVAAVVGWAGVVLHEYVGRHVSWVGAVFVSGVLSLVAVVLFALTGLRLYLRAYFCVGWGVLKVVGIVVREVVTKERVENRER